MIELRQNDYLTERIATNPNKYKLYITLRVDSDSAGWPTAIVTPIETIDTDDSFGNKYDLEEASVDHTIHIVQARKKIIPEGMHVDERMYNLLVVQQLSKMMVNLSKTALAMQYVVDKMCHYTESAVSSAELAVEENTRLKAEIVALNKALQKAYSSHKE